jgi:glycerol dehydrogenase
MKKRKGGMSMKSILFPGKFLLGKGMLDSFGEYTKSLGGKFQVIASKSVMETAKSKISKSLEGTDMVAEYVLFGGECSHNEINVSAAVSCLTPPKQQPLL